jgi:predicted protein tyrosine phosphatase
MIFVCPLSRVEEMIASHKPGRVISLLDPEWSFPELGDRYLGRHLRLRLHDICFPEESLVEPGTDHVDELLKFLGAWDKNEALLIHCRAGISRSTATAFIAACFAHPEIDEHEIAVVLRRVAPAARPNQRLIAMADRTMQRDGRMIAAITTTGRDLPWPDVEEGDSFGMPSTYQRAHES